MTTFTRDDAGHIILIARCEDNMVGKAIAGLRTKTQTKVEIIKQKIASKVETQCKRLCGSTTETISVLEADTRLRLVKNQIQSTFTVSTNNAVTLSIAD